MKERCLILAVIFVTCCHLTIGQLVIQNIRLVNGNTDGSSGRVEIQVNGAYGTICDDLWDDNDAAVACRSLGFLNGGQATTRASFGAGTGTIFLDDVGCEGDERSLVDCKMSPSIGVNDCSHNEDAGVICNTGGRTVPVATTTSRPVGPQPDNCAVQSSDVRLIAPQGVRGIGFVEVSNGGVWGSVCDDTWDELAARVVCRMLCYNTVFARPGAPDSIIKTLNASSIIVDTVQCTGNENRLQDCPHGPWNVHDCGPKEVASVTCVNLDSGPPKPPTPILQCREGYLIALFNRSRDRFLEEKHLTVETTSTTCNLIKSIDTDFVTIRVPFEDCDTKVEANTTHIIYSNTVNYARTSLDGNLARIPPYPVTVYCEMPRDVTAARDLEPQTQAVTQRAEGQFVITMSFYRNNSFTQSVNNYPVKMPLGEWLNVALLLESIDSRLKLVVPDCVATPTADRNNPTQFPLFNKNCPNEKTLGLFPLSQIKYGFRYQPFKFVNNPFVYIHCGAFVCLASEAGAECDRSCNTTKPTATTGRRKRDVAESFGSNREKYYIDSGPVQLYKPDGVDTIIERIDGSTDIISTTISIPLSTEIQEKLSKMTSPKSRPTTTTASTTSRKTTATDPKTTSAQNTPKRHSSPTTAPYTTSMPKPNESRSSSTTPSAKPLKGVWIEYPRRQTTESVNNQDSKASTEEQGFQNRLIGGVNSASNMKQTLAFCSCLLSLFLLFH